MSKIVDIVYMGRISARTGVSTILRSYSENLKSFLDNGFKLSIFGVDNNNEPSTENVKVKKNILSKYRNKIKAIGRKNKFISQILIYRFYWYNAKKSVNKYLEMQRKPDILFFQDFFSCYYYLRKRTNKESKVVLVLHTNGDTFKMVLEYFPRIMGSRCHKRLLKKERYVLDRIDKVGFVAENAAKEFMNIYPDFNKEKVFFVHNGISDINIPKINNENERIVLTCAASISTRKGQDIIVEALAELPESNKERILIKLLGDGPIKNELESRAKLLGVSDCIEFVGLTNKVDEYLQKSDGFILTSRDEGLPMCIIEAMRIGLPIFSTKIAGIPELVENNTNGVLINPNKEELVETFFKLTNGEYNLITMGNESKKIFNEKFTLGSMIDNYCMVFKNIS